MDVGFPPLPTSVLGSPRKQRIMCAIQLCERVGEALVRRLDVGPGRHVLFFVIADSFLKLIQHPAVAVPFIRSGIDHNAASPGQRSRP